MSGVMENFWETTYRQNIAKMIGVCCRYTQNRQTAEDLAHDAFLVAIDKSSSFENKGPFEAWLRRIVVNVALQYLRAQKKQKLHEELITYTFVSIEPQDEPHSNEETSFSEAELLEAISLLPEHHRLVFNLYVLDNFTHAQIGAELGLSEGTSKSHLARARKKIREILRNKLHENKKRNSVFLLFLLPYRLWNIDNFFKKGLKHFEIQPQKIAPSDRIDFRNSEIPKQNPIPFLAKTGLKNALATATVALCTSVLMLSILSHKEIKDPVLQTASDPISNSFSLVKSKEIPIKKFSKSESIAATFSKNDIISTEKTKHIENMKTLNALGALLVTSSTLAFDTISPLKNRQLPTVFENQEILENKKGGTIQLIERKETAIESDNEKLFGTFYASTVFWSSVNNAVYLKGEHVKVNLNSQKFTGSGTFSFINKISLVVIDGTPMKLNETIKLSEKKYNLVKLQKTEAIKKYGDQGEHGVVEISLAE